MAKDREEIVHIPAPNFGSTTLRLIGTSPLVINRFSAKALETMRVKQEGGSRSKKGTKRDPKDFQAVYEGARHKSAEGWDGVAAGAFRAGMISACRLVGFKMTLAKLSLFVEADGFDVVDGTPLVRITKGEPKYVEHFVRPEMGGVDIRPRPMWAEGWEIELRVRWDEDQFSLTDVINLMMRVGQQVGIGEGRPDSPKSTGMMWGLFRVEGK